MKFWLSSLGGVLIGYSLYPTLCFQNLVIFAIGLILIVSCAP